MVQTYTPEQLVQFFRHNYREHYGAFLDSIKKGPALLTQDGFQTLKNYTEGGSVRLIICNEHEDLSAENIANMFEEVFDSGAESALNSIDITGNARHAPPTRHKFFQCACGDVILAITYNPECIGVLAENFRKPDDLDLQECREIIGRIQGLLYVDSDRKRNGVEFWNPEKQLDGDMLQGITETFEQFHLAPMQRQEV